MYQREANSAKRLGRRLASLITVGMLAASSIGVATAASATTPNVPDESEAVAFFEENMARFEVPQELRASLIEKALNGETLDADAPGAVPIAVDTVTNDYGTFPVNRYADGSFDSHGVSEATTGSDGEIAARGVQFCSGKGDESGGVGTNCQAYHWTFWHNMYFRFNYEFTTGVSSKITAMPPANRGFESANSCETEVFGITQTNGTNSSNAKGDWNMTCTDISGASSTKTLGIRVPTDGATYTVQNY